MGLSFLSNWKYKDLYQLSFISPNFPTLIINFQLITYEKNPFSFGKGAKDINCATLSLDGKDSKDEQLQMKPYHDPIQASLKTYLKKSPPPDENMLGLNASVGIVKGYLITSTSFTVRLQFGLDPRNSYRILGRLSKKPTRKLHDFSYHISDSVSVETQVWMTTTTFIQHKLTISIHANEIPVPDTLFVIINNTGKYTEIFTLVFSFTLQISLTYDYVNILYYIVDNELRK